MKSLFCKCYKSDLINKIQRQRFNMQVMDRDIIYQIKKKKEKSKEYY